jgi:hypothetical protein
MNATDFRQVTRRDTQSGDTDIWPTLPTVLAFNDIQQLRNVLRNAM